jgi:hypothetical protein
MKAKEKAMEIAIKFDKYGQTDNAVKCALICVDEILESHYKVLVGVMPKVYDYWHEVKQEINKL